MPPEGARLVWISDSDVRGAREDDVYMLVVHRLHSAPEPVERRRCVVHDCEQRGRGTDTCWLEEFRQYRGARDPQPCRFEVEYTAPAPPEEPA